MSGKYRRSGVPTRDSFSRWILKVYVLGRVEARYWKPKIVIRLSTNTSPVRTCSNITVHNTNCKSQICKFGIKYYSSRVITLDSTWYLTPNNTRIPSYFWITKRGRVICQNLMPGETNLGFKTKFASLFLNLSLLRLCQHGPPKLRG